MIPSLLFLSYFKYANFLVDQLNTVGDSIGWGNIAWTSVALPIGISFYTFQALSYTIDVSRGRCEALRNPFYFVLFVTLFPHAIAGPIVRFHEIAPELEKRSTRVEDFAEGSVRFIWGLFKKVVIADTISPIADAAFDPNVQHLSAVGRGPARSCSLSRSTSTSPATPTWPSGWRGFSDSISRRTSAGRTPRCPSRTSGGAGTSPSRIGFAITSTSRWAGTGASRAATAFNLIVVFAATGIWHGAAWTFLALGPLLRCLHVVGSATAIPATSTLPRTNGRRRARTFLIVLLGWVLFRAVSLTDAVDYFGAMLGLKDGFITGDIVLRSIDVRELLVPGDRFGQPAASPRLRCRARALQARRTPRRRGPGRTVRGRPSSLPPAGGQPDLQPVPLLPVLSHA